MTIGDRRWLRRGCPTCCARPFKQCIYYSDLGPYRNEIEHAARRRRNLRYALTTVSLAIHGPLGDYR